MPYISFDAVFGVVPTPVQGVSPAALNALAAAQAAKSNYTVRGDPSPVTQLMVFIIQLDMGQLTSISIFSFPRRKLEDANLTMRSQWLVCKTF